MTATAPEAQLSLAARCARCGRPLPALADLADVAARLARQAAEAQAALASMRLALPAVVTRTVADMAEGLPGIAQAMACAAGRCTTAAAEEEVAP